MLRIGRLYGASRGLTTAIVFRVTVGAVTRGAGLAVLYIGGAVRVVALDPGSNGCLTEMGRYDPEVLDGRVEDGSCRA